MHGRPRAGGGSFEFVFLLRRIVRALLWSSRFRRVGFRVMLPVCVWFVWAPQKVKPVTVSGLAVQPTSRVLYR